MAKLYVVERRNVPYKKALRFVTALFIGDAHRTGERMFGYGKFKTRTPTQEERRHFDSNIKGTANHYRGTRL